MNCPSCNADNLEGARFCAKCGALMPAEAEAERDTLLGQTVGGRYHIIKVLGEGGMGRVYEAERALAGVQQRVAVKTLHPHLSKDAQVVERFHRECRTVAALRHPNTIKVEDFGQAEDGTLYIAMEFVDGVSLSKDLEVHGKMAPERVERILGQVCGSLAEAHKQGVVHRDLKPDNIVLMDVGDDVDFVKVLDFGIAARKDSTDAAKERKLTQQGMVLGTPPYMSPEQFSGKELDARSDIYSLGVMAYEMLTGRLPFDANTPWEWATKHMTAQPFPFEDSPTVTDIPGKMKAAILKSLAKSPNDRQANVKEFFEELSESGVRIRTTHLGDSLNPAERGASSPAVSAPGATSAMAPFGSDKGKTQMATPLGMEARMGDGPIPSNPQMPIPPPPPGGMTAPSGGGNKGLLLGIAGVVGLGVVVLLGVGLKSAFSHSGDAPVPDVGASGTDPPPPTVSGISPTSTLPTAIDTTGIKVPIHPVGGGPPVHTGPTPTTLTGDEACNDASRRAGNGDVNGAINSYRGCSGPGKEGAKRAIGAAIPVAVGRAAMTGQCGRARQLNAEGHEFGAANTDVDSKFPSCKGKP